MNFLPVKIPRPATGKSPACRCCLTGATSATRKQFPQELLDKLVKRANLPGYLGNCHSSGTVILDQLGEEHMKTGKPIFYTSADSVFQIACHEETFGLDKLYELCEIAREELTEGGYNIGRVIARPFVGDKAGNFQRTGNRHDGGRAAGADRAAEAGRREKRPRGVRG